MINQQETQAIQIMLMRIIKERKEREELVKELEKKMGLSEEIRGVLLSESLLQDIFIYNNLNKIATYIKVPLILAPKSTLYLRILKIMDTL